MPRPPPPAAALTINGKPISRACSSALPKVIAPIEPGTVGTPASFMALIAETLLPINRMCSGCGPTKVKPASSTRSANSAFSDKNPYPG